MKRLLVSIVSTLFVLGMAAVSVAADPPAKSVKMEVKVLEDGKVLAAPAISTVPGRAVSFDATTQDAAGKAAHRLEMSLLPTVDGSTVTIEGAIKTYVDGKPGAEVKEVRRAASGETVSYQVDVDGTGYVLRVTPTVE